MIEAPVSRMSSGVRALTVALVPTGMNWGVSTVPWVSVSIPVLARVDPSAGGGVGTAGATGGGVVASVAGVAASVLASSTVAGMALSGTSVSTGCSGNSSGPLLPHPDRAGRVNAISNATSRVFMGAV